MQAKLKIRDFASKAIVTLEVSNLKKKKRAVCLNPLILLTSFDEFLSTFCDAGITIHSVNRRD